MSRALHDLKKQLRDMYEKEERLLTQEYQRMLNLIEDMESDFYDYGFQDGYDQGHDEGYDEGHQDGYDEGTMDAQAFHQERRRLDSG